MCSDQQLGAHFHWIVLIDDICRRESWQQRSFRSACSQFISIGFITDLREIMSWNSLRTAIGNAALEFVVTKNYNHHLQPKTGIIVDSEDECIDKATALALEPNFLSRKLVADFVSVDTHSNEGPVFGIVKVLHPKRLLKDVFIS